MQTAKAVNLCAQVYAVILGDVRREACDSGHADGDSRTDTGCSSEEIQPRLEPKAITQHAVKRSLSTHTEKTGQEVLHFRDSGVDGDF